MGFNKTDKDPPVPIDVLGTSSMSLTTECSQTLYSLTYKTLRRGDMLGIIRPYWIKVAESEQQLAWLQTMVQRELVVRDLESFAKAINGRLRSEELKCKEDERFLLMGLMRLKLRDEKLNLKEVTRQREQMRQQIIGEIGGSRRYATLMKKIRREVTARKTSLRIKYREKVNHLARVRKKDLEEKKSRRELPAEICEFKECMAFDMRKLEKLEVAKIDGVVIGEVIVDKDELAVLKLNPKFCVLKRLIDEDIERDIELGVTKLRYEINALEERISLNKSKGGDIDENTNTNAKRARIDEKIEVEDKLTEAKSRQIFDPVRKIFDYSKRRTTDMQENTKVFLPKLTGPKWESELELIRNTLMGEYRDYIKEIETKKKKDLGEKYVKDRNQEWENLTASEKRGLKKLRNRIAKNEIVMVKTDKSGKMAIMSKEKYLKMGIENNKDY